MTIADLLPILRGNGIRLDLGMSPGRLRLDGPEGSLTPDLVAAVAENKQELLALLCSPHIAASQAQAGASDDAFAQVTIDDQAYCYRRRWAGQRLAPPDGHLAFDTETSLVDLKQDIPRLALASASDGQDSHCLVHPDDLGAFLLVHKDLHFVCHNAAFDFWVVEQHLRSHGEEEAQRAWWAIAEEDRLHDSMLLDALVRLAENDTYPAMRDLATVAKEYAGLVISKSDPYRLRYAEIIGVDWTTVDRGFFDYGIKDAIVTRRAYLAIRRKAEELVRRFGYPGRDIYPDAIGKYGLLTEAIQVKKAIALAQITRNGMTLNLPLVRQTEAPMREELLRVVAMAQAIYPVYKTDKSGDFVLSGTSNVPGVNETLLRESLSKIKDEIENEHGLAIAIPVTTKGISASAADWAEYAHLHAFLECWLKAKELAKLIQFFNQFQEQVDLRAVAAALQVPAETLAAALRVGIGPESPCKLPVGELLAAVTKHRRQLQGAALEPDRLKDEIQVQAKANPAERLTVHPGYSVMVRTGRTSCSSPNIQQIPRQDEFRQIFVAPPGYHLLVVDYGYIELRTLAATTLHRYGASAMADIIKAGVDPHAHTAAMMLGMPVEEFMGWKGNETETVQQNADGSESRLKLKDRFDHARQAAKSINFGVPGGLGPARLVDYARNTYGVRLSLEEARAYRDRLTREIYPELDCYLAEDSVAIIARNLRSPVAEVRACLGDTHLSSIHKVLEGNPEKQDGTPYKTQFVNRIWETVAALNRNPALHSALQGRQASPELAAMVCHAGVTTLTGRIRGRVRYSAARNCPFQGLAADGAALALFDLVREGFRVTAFVHDEVHVLLPDEGGFVSEAKVQRVQEILCRRMEEVLVGGIPVACEAAVSYCWSKRAELTVRDGRVYPWTPGGVGLQKPKY